jgi:hypothetical protein
MFCNKQLTKDFVPDYLHVEGQKQAEMDYRKLTEVMHRLQTNGHFIFFQQIWNTKEKNFVFTGAELAIVVCNSGSCIFIYILGHWFFTDR